MLDEGWLVTLPDDVVFTNGPQGVGGTNGPDDETKVLLLDEYSEEDVVTEAFRLLALVTGVTDEVRFAAGTGLVEDTEDPETVPTLPPLVRDPAPGSFVEGTTPEVALEISEYSLVEFPYHGDKRGEDGPMGWPVLVELDVTLGPVSSLVLESVDVGVL